MPRSATAWDTVEELNAAASHAKEVQASTDPLEQYCEGDPSADECRVYGELPPNRDAAPPVPPPAAPHVHRRPLGHARQGPPSAAADLFLLCAPAED